MPAYQIVVFNQDVLYDSVRQQYHGTGTPEENAARYKKMFATLEALGIIPMVIEEEVNERGKTRILVRNLSKIPQCQLQFLQRCAKPGEPAEYPFDLIRIKDVLARVQSFEKIKDHADGLEKLQASLRAVIEEKTAALEPLKQQLGLEVGNELALQKFKTEQLAAGKEVPVVVDQKLAPILARRRQVEANERELQVLIDNYKLAQFDYVIAAHILEMPASFVLSEMEPVAWLQLLPALFNMELGKTNPLRYIDYESIFYVETQSNMRYLDEASSKNLKRAFAVEKLLPLADDGAMSTTIDPSVVTRCVAAIHFGIADYLRDLLEDCARELRSRNLSLQEKLFDLALQMLQRFKALQDKNIAEKLKKIESWSSDPKTETGRCTILRVLYIYAEYLYGKARALYKEADIPVALVRTDLRAARLYDKWNAINFGILDAQRSKGDYRVRAFTLLYEATLIVERYQTYVKALTPADAKKLESYAREVSREFEYWLKELSVLTSLRLTYGSQSRQNGPSPSQAAPSAPGQEASLLELRKPLWEALEKTLREHATPITMAGLMLEFTKMIAIQPNYVLVDVSPALTDAAAKIGKPGQNNCVVS